MTNKKWHVLIVEDNPGDRRLIEVYLQVTSLHKYALTFAENMQQTLSVLETQEFNLIILDLTLPDSQGIETLFHVRSLHPEVPIIILSGIGDEELSINAIQSGAQDFIVKEHLDEHSLSRSIQYALERHRLLQELKKAHEWEEHLAFHDPLTDLPNRFLMMDRLNSTLKLAKRNKSRFSILFIDLDNFKNINDSFGHTIGDELLKNVANRLKNAVRESDTVARISGDEFMILLQDVSDEQGIDAVAGKILFELAKKLLIGKLEISISASIGFSIYPENGNDINTLIQRADCALYVAKDRGKNTFQKYEDMFEKDIFISKMGKNLLVNAIENKEFLVYFQPQISVKNRDIVGAEALVRWNHAMYGLLLPHSFIPHAENNAVQHLIDDYVFTIVCQEMQSWHEGNFPPMNISINLSAGQLMKKNLVEEVNHKVRQFGIEPSQLVFEITESNALSNLEMTIENLIGLQHLGFQIAIDDFGKGYSSLSYLNRLPLDILKIDRSLIREVGQNARGTIILSSVISMARKLHLAVVAEGVENGEQFDFIANEACDLAQGFYFWRPMPAREFATLVFSSPEARVAC